ncbi:hypothetical protein SAPIO_CDS8762 [Scedosporium apiospermum]|uniref:F-box domain-containing protein n=1 Tax=Pseudallescheria apiosperma TaxID=563466 RepID=A0A084FXM3_PSEDA|nr:uncharacterized protein SAPIO_CDS8762 [Scedosporium apiospermum]KEZ39835.1 hypothetical protein SAPIO_CDS8762 [Scedosporium apiospermum]
MTGHDLSVLVHAQSLCLETDTFGKVKYKRLPLLLPEVKEGRPVTSTSPLFSLPLEILASIIDFIADDKPTLAKLAQVSRDCRQLAGSCQYADLCLDYSQTSWHLLHSLEREARIRQSPGIILNNVVSPTFIGPCIRTLTVHSHPSKVAEFHQDFFDVLRARVPSCHITPEQIIELGEKALEKYLTKYRAPLLAAIEYAMPNLEAVSWYDGVCLEEDFFRIVTNLSIRHLKLSTAHIGGAYLLRPPLTPVSVPLKSLYFDAELCQRGLHKAKQAESVSPLLASLLKRCRATLERLTIGPMLAERLLSFGCEPMMFANLEYLDLSATIALPIGTEDYFKNAISTCQTLPNLETLVVPQFYRHPDLATSLEVVNFISRNSHAKKLSVGQASPELMSSLVVPLLTSGRWSNLTSLSLSWAGPGTDEATRPNIASIPVESLAVIGSLGALEQLSLSAGESRGWRHQWLIDHDAMRWALRGLPMLKRLAFSRDTYVAPGLEISTHLEAYYERYLHIELTPAQRELALDRLELGGINSSLLTTIRHRRRGGPPEPDHPELWERYHRNRMLHEAEEYATVLPSLEWVYCGQWPISIKEEQKPPNGAVRVALPLHYKRDSCWTVLKRMFGMEPGDDSDE